MHEEPTTRDILTAIEALRTDTLGDVAALRSDMVGAMKALRTDMLANDAALRSDIKAVGQELHVFRDETQARFAVMGQRFDGVDRTLAEHSVALTELATDVGAVKKTLLQRGRKRRD